MVESQLQKSKKIAFDLIFLLHLGKLCLFSRDQSSLAFPGRTATPLLQTDGDLDKCNLLC
jgi:hypothetical protein